MPEDIQLYKPVEIFKDLPTHINARGCAIGKVMPFIQYTLLCIVAIRKHKN